MGQRCASWLWASWTAGPYIDESGYWVVEVDLDSLEVQDMAFVRYPSVPPLSRRLA